MNMKKQIFAVGLLALLLSGCMPVSAEVITCGVNLPNSNGFTIQAFAPARNKPLTRLVFTTTYNMDDLLKAFGTDSSMVNPNLFVESIENQLIEEVSKNMGVDTEQVTLKIRGDSVILTMVVDDVKNYHSQYYPDTGTGEAITLEDYIGAFDGLHLGNFAYCD